MNVTTETDSWRSVGEYVVHHHSNPLVGVEFVRAYVKHDATKPARAITVAPDGTILSCLPRPNTKNPYEPWDRRHGTHNKQHEAREINHAARLAVEAYAFAPRVAYKLALRGAA